MTIFVVISLIVYFLIAGLYLLASMFSSSPVNESIFCKIILIPAMIVAFTIMVFYKIYSKFNKKSCTKK